MPTFISILQIQGSRTPAKQTVVIFDVGGARGVNGIVTDTSSSAVGKNR